MSLNASIDRYRATKRPRRESLDSAAEVRRLSDSLADKLDLLQSNHKLVVDNLNKLDLLQLNNSRPSVITSTPPVSPTRQPVEFTLPPESPSGSQVSSLDGSIFEDAAINILEQVEAISPEFDADLIMDQAEKSVRDKFAEYKIEADLYPPTRLNAGTFKFHFDKIETIESKLGDAVKAAHDFCTEYAQQLGEDNVTRWKNFIKSEQNSFIQYTVGFATVLQQFTSPNPSQSQAQVSAQANSYHDQHIQLLREQTEAYKLSAKSAQDAA